MNRSATTMHSMWSPRDSVSHQQQIAFEAVARRMNRPVADWMRVCSGSNLVTVGEIVGVRNAVRAFADEIVDQMRTLHAAAERENRGLNDRETREFNELRDASEACAKALRHAETAIETIGGASAARSVPAGGGLGGGWRTGMGEAPTEHVVVEARSSAWRDQLLDRADPEMRSAHETGELSIADFLRGLAGMRSSEATKRALSAGTDSAGGFAVPTVLMPGILDALVPASTLLQAGARLVQVNDGEGGKSLNWAAINTLPTASWRAEAGTVAESDPVFRSISTVPRSLAFVFKVSRELLADGQGLEAALRTAIAGAFARELDRVGLRGTGTAPQPRGILNTSGVQAIGNGPNGASLASTRWANLMGAVQSILGADGPMPTAAIMAPRTLVGLGNLADTTNQPLARPDTIAGMEFFATSQIPVNLTVGTSTDCSEAYIGDFRSVLFVQREAPSIQLLRELYAGTGEIGFLCHVRADVVVTYPSTLAVVTGIRP